MGNKGRVIMVGDDNASDAFCATIDVESIICGCQLIILWRQIFTIYPALRYLVAVQV
jgi:hypothetical protein